MQPSSPERESLDPRLPLPRPAISPIAAPPTACPRCRTALAPDWSGTKCPGCGVEVVTALRHAESNRSGRATLRAEKIRACIILGLAWIVLLPLLLFSNDARDLPWFLLKQAITVPIGVGMYTLLGRWIGSDYTWLSAALRIAAIFAWGDVGSLLFFHVHLFLAYQIGPSVVVVVMTITLLGLDYLEGALAGFVFAMVKVVVFVALVQMTGE